MGANDGSIIDTIITTHMPRNEAAAPGQLCSGIRIQSIDIVQPPGILISPIVDMDAHQRTVTAALTAKKIADTPTKVRREARSETMHLPQRLGGLLLGAYRVVDDLRPHRVGRGTGSIGVMPVPPLVRRGLGITLGRVLPALLAPQRSHVEVAPGTSHRFIAAVVDEVSTKHPIAVAKKHVRAMPEIYAEVRIEGIRERVPGDRPSHARFQTRDIALRCARYEREVGVSGVQMSGVGDLVCHHGTTAAGMLWPAEHAGLKKSAVDD